MGRILANTEQLDTTRTDIDSLFLEDGSSQAPPPPPSKDKPKEKYTTTQKVLATIGITAVLYYILYKAGSLD